MHNRTSQFSFSESQRDWDTAAAACRNMSQCQQWSERYCDTFPQHKVTKLSPDAVTSRSIARFQNRKNKQCRQSVTKYRQKSKVPMVKEDPHKMAESILHSQYITEAQSAYLQAHESITQKSHKMIISTIWWEWVHIQHPTCSFYMSGDPINSVISLKEATVWWRCVIQSVARSCCHSNHCHRQGDQWCSHGGGVDGDAAACTTWNCLRKGCT